MDENEGGVRVTGSSDSLLFKSGELAVTSG